MSTFNQGVPGVATLINSSATIISGNAASANALTVRQFGGGNVFSAQTTTGSTALFVGANGNVGIGTTNPSAGGLNSLAGALLDVYASGTGVSSNVNISAGCDGTASGSNKASLIFNIKGAGGGIVNGGITHQLLGSDYSFNIQPQTLGTSVMVVKGNGTVGIGTTSPQTLFHVTATASNSAIFIDNSLGSIGPRPLATNAGSANCHIWADGAANGSSDGGFLRIAAGGGAGAGNKSYIDLSGYSGTADMNQNIVFGTQGAERMRIRNDGNVGIGTTNPGYTLDCSTGTVQANQVRAPSGNYLTLINGAGGSQIVLQGTTTAITGGTVYMTGGNVGIGTTSPTYTLDVSGGIRCAVNGTHTNAEGSNNAITAYAPGGATINASIWMGYDPTADCGYINSARLGQIRPVCLQTRGGNVGIGATSPGAQLTVQNSVNQVGALNTFQCLSYSGSQFVIAQDPGNANLNSGWNGAQLACLFVGKATGSGRSISAAGTLNASGADYAEYMTKTSDFTIKKGDVIGVNAQGLLTNVFRESVTFIVKSTDPCMVGGDTWGTEEALGLTKPKEVKESEEGYAEYQTTLTQFNAKLEEARARVDRIAFAGQVPVNVLGATPGQYIIPMANDDGSISGQAVSSPTMDQYMAAVGKVIKVLPDGRAQIIVKVV